MNHPAEHATLTNRSLESAFPQRLPWRLYSVEGLASVAANLLISGVYFYTADRFHWGLKQNFLLATGQGVFYVAGALSANGLTQRLDRRRALAIVYIVMTLLPLFALFAVDRPVIVTVILLAYSFVAAVGWPIIESLVSTDGDSHSLSRRIAIYNVVWAALGVVTLAIEGTLIVHWSVGVFLIPAIGHGISALLMLNATQIRNDAETPRRGDAKKRVPPEIAISASELPRVSASSSPLHAEPELLRVRTLALWLSRGVLPATYVAIYSLMAMMPSLPVMRQIGEESRTLVGSVWMVTRLLAFLLLGLGTWWHTRPRVMLLAAIVMLAAFFGTTLRPSELLPHISPALDLVSMICAQLALGAAMGMIYAASLYFGMVLSDGSTEHGGYHEALIGVGFILGPGVGAIAQFAFPGREIFAGIAAVGALVALSVAAVAIMAAIAARRENANDR